MHADELTILIVQVALILALSRLVGMLFARFRQPQVIGEMVAGIMLGPSLLGLVAPSVYETLFPMGSIVYLNILSQFGVLFFLFLVGLEFDPQLVRRRGRAAVVNSASSIAVPFVIGIALTFVLYSRLFNDPQSKHFIPSALFMGAAISVTAFPVLARILTERNLHKTTVGAISITGAAVNDVLAWCLLAFVVAVARYDPNHGPLAALITAALAAGYVAFMQLAMKPFLARFQVLYDRRGRLTQNVFAAIVLLVLASSYVTEKIGIHALFGAFLMGCVMPKGSQFIRELSEKLEDYTVVFLLPLFFAFAGLRTDLTHLFMQHQWGYAGIIILAACGGKIGGAAVAARACGQPWRESLAIGALMNTRGLMELIILTIGLSLGVINNNIFAMMVIMALVTTALTTPLLFFIYPERILAAEAAAVAAPGGAGKKLYSVLLPVSDPRSGRALLRIAALIAGKTNDSRRLLALNLRPPEERDAYRAGLDDSVAGQPNPVLDPLLQDARREGIEVEPLSFVSRDVADDIASIARSRQIDLVLMGYHKPVFGRAILGGTVHHVLTKTPAAVGIFVNRGFRDATASKPPTLKHLATGKPGPSGPGQPLQNAPPLEILVPYLGSTHDRLALELAQRLASNGGAAITVVHVVAPRRGGDEKVLGARGEVDRVFAEPGQPLPVKFRVVEDHSPVQAVLRESAGADLLVIGVAEEWGLESHLFGFRAERIAQECRTSLLIVRKFGRSRNGVRSVAAP
jgi:Kef-type K+ transport system membrane component KefB